MKKRNKGFTLIELLIVIAIIGILSSIVIASLNSARKKARDSRRVADIKQIQLALEMYFDANTSYPTTIVALVTGGQIASEPKDPIGNTAYSYAYCPATNSVFYHLGASLEEQSNAALSSDKDCNSNVAGSCSTCATAYTSGFVSGSGSPESAQKCNAADAGNYCYDVVP